MIKLSAEDREAGYRALFTNFTPEERRAFKRAAFAHCATLDPREIETIRERAASSPSGIDGERFNPAATPEQLVEKVFESGILIQHLVTTCLLQPVGGELADMFYAPGVGIFIYSPPCHSTSLQIHLSHPALPRGW